MTDENTTSPEELTEENDTSQTENAVVETEQDWDEDMEKSPYDEQVLEKNKYNQEHMFDYTFTPGSVWNIRFLESFDPTGKEDQIVEDFYKLVKEQGIETFVENNGLEQLGAKYSVEHTKEYISSKILNLPADLVEKIDPENFVCTVVETRKFTHLNDLLGAAVKVMIGASIHKLDSCDLYKRIN